MPADLKQALKPVYTATARPTLVTVPAMTYLMVDGQGDPNTSPDFPAASETLYPVAYALKFMLKARGIETSVMPLEGLWWMEAGASVDFVDRTGWRWTLMIAVPDFVTPADLDQALSELARKKKVLPRAERLRLERLDEGQAAQVLHVGPYSEELPTIERLHAAIEANGWRFAGKHHEIYLGDPRRSAPEKLKTILRQPVLT